MTINEAAVERFNAQIREACAPATARILDHIRAECEQSVRKLLDFPVTPVSPFLFFNVKPQSPAPQARVPFGFQPQ